MRISTLKSKTDDYRLRGAISELWECYGEQLGTLPEDTTIDEVFSLACFRYAAEMETIDVEHSKAIRRSLEDLSKLLYGNKSQWKAEAGLTTIPREPPEAEIRYQSLCNLYDNLEYSPGESDIIKLIAKDEELTEACRNAISWEEIYSHCERIIISRIQTGSCKYISAKLMYTLSEQLYHSPYYWLIQNGLTSKKVRSMYNTLL